MKDYSVKYRQGVMLLQPLRLLNVLRNLKTIVTMINDSGQGYFSTELCGEAKKEIPGREQPLDEYTIRELDKYQAGWKVIE